MFIYIIVMVLLGLLICIDGVKCYRVYKTSTVKGKGTLLVIHYVLLFLLVFFVLNTMFSIFEMGIPI